MLTLYAAIGYARMTRDASGREEPVILKAGQEYGVCWQEFLIWCALIWNIQSYDELKAEFEAKEAATGLDSDYGFDHYLERLTSRGLIASGTGYTGAAALYELLGGLFLRPVGETGWQRICNAVRLLLAGKLSFAGVIERIRGPKLKETQRAAWRLIRQQELSTAELIQCVDTGVQKLKSGPDIVKAIYDGKEIDYKNVRLFARFSDLKGTILEAVANLYLQQQVYFELACGGEAY